MCCVQLCLTLCNPMNCSLPVCTVHGIFQARILGWACLFLLQGNFLTQGSNLHPLHWQVNFLPLSLISYYYSPFLSFSTREHHVQLFVTLWTIQSMEFSRPEVGSCSLFQGSSLLQGIEPRSPASQADSLPAEPPRKSSSL